MKTFTALLVLLVALPAFAGRVITYTAVSERSQEDANNAAMAGVAKQIVSQVDSRQVLTKKESKSGKNSNLDESFFVSNSVKSSIKLKGVKIERIKTDKGYKATAYPAVGPDVTLAGGTYVPVGVDEAVVDRNLVTAPAWPGDTAIVREFAKLMGAKIEI